MDKERKSIKQGNTGTTGQVESAGTRVMQIHDLIIKNFIKVEQSIISLVSEKRNMSLLLEQSPLKETTLIKCNTLIMRFERAMEIVCNIFFRAVESAEFGDLSENTSGCIARMKELTLVTSEELWKRMILGRSVLSSSPGQEGVICFCKEILTLYSDELVHLCSSVKERYEIPDLIS